jgi:hypothetical protein
MFNALICIFLRSAISATPSLEREVERTNGWPSTSRAVDNAHSAKSPIRHFAFVQIS